MIGGYEYMNRSLTHCVALRASKVQRTSLGLHVSRSSTRLNVIIIHVSLDKLLVVLFYGTLIKYNSVRVVKV